MKKLSVIFFLLLIFLLVFPSSGMSQQPKYGGREVSSPMTARLKELKKELGLPPISQICVVVKDMHKAVEHYSSVFGLGPWTEYEFAPEMH
jgi:hypothetical protein